MNLRKNEIHILNIYTLFLHRFSLVFVKFWLYKCKSSGEEKLLTDVFVYYVHGITSIERYVSQSTISIICDVTYT